MKSSSAKGAVRNYFALDADAYRRAYTDDAEQRGTIFRERRRIVFDLLNTPLGRVLDVGSGPGVFTQGLLERGGVCCTVDLSVEMLRAARRSPGAASMVPNALMAGDVEALPFLDRAFDSIICVGVLQYLVDVRAAIRELARCLAPAGQIILTFPNRTSPLTRFQEATIGSVRATYAVVKRFGAWKRVSPARLTFRSDIPNRSFSVAEIVRQAATADLSCEAVVYHCLAFPFSVPGLSGAVGAWNRRATAGVLEGPRRHWGREAIVRLVRA
jgi:ubiquinone/menaquinone biosynthesis C-methylase UbiE